MMKTKQSVRRTYVKPGTETVAMPAVGVLDYTSFKGKADENAGETKRPGTDDGGGAGAGSVSYGGDLGSPDNPAKGNSGDWDAAGWD